MNKLINILSGWGDSKPVKPNLPEGLRIYCIGDIHGRVDLLQQIHKSIQKDVAGFQGTRKLIYLGDYIDRGENSRDVIDLLTKQPLPEFDSVYLRGNHEQSMLDFLDQAKVGRNWFTYGGLATLVSYKVKLSKLPTQKSDFEEIQTNFRALVPQSHIDFLERTEVSCAFGSFYFVHAGIRPGVPLKKQRSEDQLWIREEFIRCKKPYEKIIIHGHTISDEPDFNDNRIGIDTGAYISGKLTCLVMEADTLRIIQAKA